MADRGKNKIVGESSNFASSKPQRMLSLFAKIGFKSPLLDQRKKMDCVAKEDPKSEELCTGDKPSFTGGSVVVKLPMRNRIVVPSLDTEFREGSGMTHNPMIIWQVYALSGFIFLNWLWTRWKETKEREKRSSSSHEHLDSDDSSSPDTSD